MREIDINKPDQEEIEFIESLLNKAKNGEIQSIAVATSVNGYATGSAWAGMNKNNMAMLGEIEVLKRDVMDLLIELRVDPMTGEQY